MKNMTTIKVEPLVEVGGAKFGDSRKQVRNALSAFQDRKVVAPSVKKVTILRSKIFHFYL